MTDRCCCCCCVGILLLTHTIAATAAAAAAADCCCCCHWCCLWLLLLPLLLLPNAISEPSNATSCQTIAVSKPCRCHISAILLSFCADAMSVPYRCQVVAMSMPCRCHVGALSLPSRCHVAAMSIPCHLSGLHSYSHSSWLPTGNSKLFAIIPSCPLDV